MPRYRLNNEKGLEFDEVALKISLIQSAKQIISFNYKRLPIKQQKLLSGVHKAIVLDGKDTPEFFEVILYVLQMQKDVSAEETKSFMIFEGLCKVLGERGYTYETVRPLLLEADAAAKDSDSAASDSDDSSKFEESFVALDVFFECNRPDTVAYSPGIFQAAAAVTQAPDPKEVTEAKDHRNLTKGS
ncbi:MAG: hypothetical protein K0U23_04295 [Gammaproteobacteria bacterium]|nr:hypothetical protein [Gammaproteobacteria bacterium]